MSNRSQSISTEEQYLMERETLPAFFQTLKDHGYQVIGPTRQDGAIVYDRIESDQDLPIGWTDRQEAGSYRIERRSDQAVFGYNVGPNAWKKFLHPPQVRLWEAKKEGQKVAIHPNSSPPPKYAFVGVRACELNAILKQDRIFMHDHFTDPIYKARRDESLIVAVNCSQAASTCFCVSMQTGPKVTQGFDLSLTEILNANEHHFLVEVGSSKGAAILERLPLKPASDTAKKRAEEIISHTASQMGRHLDTTGIRDLLVNNPNHPRWEEVAERCLTCANCTMVCPTCFCTTIEDTSDLTGDHAERWRRWDSCFTMSFSYIHGGSVRSTTKSRYRQWMTHKLATWMDQFGSSGCVGCGRCIAWCPVGIDITEEVAAIRSSSQAKSPNS